MTASPPARAAPAHRKRAARAGGEAVMEKATFGAGCFWCLEAAAQTVDGVTSAVSGFMGGQRPDPTYEQVCRGDTGHAEVVQITFDPARVSYETLLGLFWKIHDPTQLNRQGADIGPQYRSVIFYHTPAQQQAAARSRDEQNRSGAHARPVVTAIEAAGPFYPAGPEHQNYYRRNPQQAYCRLVIRPKLEKLKRPAAPAD